MFCKEIPLQNTFLQEQEKTYGHIFCINQFSGKVNSQSCVKCGKKLLKT